MPPPTIPPIDNRTIDDDLDTILDKFADSPGFEQLQELVELIRSTFFK